jgi:hypothetical protein
VDTETAIENHIASRLFDTLGFQAANAVLTRATLCYAIVDGNEKQRYAAFVHSVCSDERVFDAWGAAEAAGQERAWLDLLGHTP